MMPLEWQDDPGFVRMHNTNEQDKARTQNRSKS